MKFKVETPSKALVEEFTPEEMGLLVKLTSYTNTSNAHLAKRHYNNRWLMSKNREAWEAKLAELKAAVHKSVLFQEDGRYFVRPGSLPYISLATTDNTEFAFTYPTPKKIPWAKPLPFELYDYQEQSVESLINVKHGNVQICTGAGKSAIILKICRETGFRAAIVAPGKVVFDELLEKFEHHLGKNNVGTFGDGKKKIGKRITICIGDSLSNIKKDTAEWEFFSGLDMLCVDESHTWGAETLESLCHGIFSDVPYRFFFSATQTRGDGAEKLLQSIIGKTVHSLTTKEAVAGGYICPHDYTIIELGSSNPYYQTADALDMKRAHFLNNKNIANFVAKLCNADATTNRRQTLVLVEELSQISRLLPMLTVPAAIAHAETKPARLEELGLYKVKVAESVEKFNKGEVMVLIGTSCIATGTNIFPSHNTVNWVGGASEIKTKQGTVGRSVRLGSHNPWAAKCTPKVSCKIFDFDVFDISVMESHLESRIGYYEESGSEIRKIRLK